MERLKATLVLWLERLCAGPHDDAYFEERAKIGRMHVEVGVPQRFVFGAMALIRAALVEVTEAMPPADGAAARSALGRLLDLELSVMMETYRHHYVARIQRTERVEKRRLEHALARSETRYANAVELAPLLVVGLDGAGAIVLFNTEAERTSGVSRDEATGQRFLDLLVSAEMRGRAAESLARARDGVEALEADLRTRAGRERTIAWQLAPVPQGSTEEEEIVLFAIGTDVTEQQALLARTVQTERLAAIGTLAAGLAHEIRNPLHGALLHVTFLERALAKESGSQDARDAVALVGDEIRRLSMLVKDFLVFARPAPPILAPVALRAVAERVVDLVRAEAAASGTAVVLDAGPSELVLDLDAAKIEQALLNLARNAVDALAGSAGGRVTLRIRRRPRQAVVEVEDDGPGLPGPDAPIFDAFYSTKPQGTGLGLAIVHRVVTDHHGTIDVDSAPGRTVFRIALPLPDPDADGTERAGLSERP